jgi:hypothetical protein
MNKILVVTLVAAVSFLFSCSTNTIEQRPKSTKIILNIHERGIIPINSICSQAIKPGQYHACAMKIGKEWHIFVPYWDGSKSVKTIWGHELLHTVYYNYH